MEGKRDEGRWAMEGIRETVDDTRGDMGKGVGRREEDLRKGKGDARYCMEGEIFDYRKSNGEWRILEDREVCVILLTLPYTICMIIIPIPSQTHTSFTFIHHSHYSQLTTYSRHKHTSFTFIFHSHSIHTMHAPKLTLFSSHLHHNPFLLTYGKAIHSTFYTDLPVATLSACSCLPESFF